MYKTNFYFHSFFLTDNNASSGPDSQDIQDGIPKYYSDFFATELAMPEWEAWATIFSLSLVIIVTVVGNILVIISVFTYTPLKITPNYFIVSLAMADLTVSACVLPFNIVHSVLGRWVSSLKVDSYFV